MCGELMKVYVDYGDINEDVITRPMFLPVDNSQEELRQSTQVLAHAELSKSVPTKN